jgi:hypothetical protein
MSWHFSRAPVEASSADISSAGELSAPSSESSTPPTFSLRAKTMASCPRSRSGMTSEPLTADHGAAVLTWCLAASRARTSARLAAALGSAGPSRACGAKWLASFARWAPSSSSWKTAQCSLLGVSESFSVTWPRSGTMRNGACLERLTLARTMSVSESGLLPTPRASDATRTDSPSERRRKSPSIVSAAATWPTPLARDHGPEGRSYTGASSPDLPMAVRLAAGTREPIGPLNPTWIEWLMGWPLAWTAPEPLEMDRFHEWQRQHSSCCAREGAGSP